MKNRDIEESDDLPEVNGSGEIKKSEGDSEHVAPERLPREVKEVMEFALSSTQRIGPMPNPIIEKITEKHIDAVLETSEKSSERSFLDAKESRRFSLAYTLIAAVLFVFLTIFIGERNMALYEEIIKLTIVFLGGFGSGFGVKNYIMPIYTTFPIIIRIVTGTQTNTQDISLVVPCPSILCSMRLTAQARSIRFDTPETSTLWPDRT